MTHAFAYCRTSSLTNSEGDTFVRQMKAIKTYAYSHDLEIVRGFEEVITGTSEWEHRPQWVEMMQSLNGVRTIVIECLNRLARDLMVQEHIIADLKQRDIVLISVAEPDLGSDEPTRVLMRHIMGAISSYERAMLVTKLKDARNRKKVATGRCEGRKPFGHYPGEDLVVQRMQMFRREGNSFDAIAGYLNSEHVPTRTGGKWFASVVRDVLLRERADADKLRAAPASH